MPWTISEIKQFRKKLLIWYEIHRRDLPWRRTSDPYAIALSEVMLQQTQVKTVIPYYERWLKQFPDWDSLSKASLQKILKAWEGLGYYQRAKNFQKAAKVIVAKYQGKLPANWELIRELPGFGPYTAGAVASIAFSLHRPIVDGNVIRVLTRLFNWYAPVNLLQTQKKLWKYAEVLVPLKNPGDFNQALMELGATICVKGNPSCLLCPVHMLCRAKAPQELPLKLNRPTTTHLDETIGIYFNKNAVSLVQVKDQKRWHGLWRFPALLEKPSHDPWKEFIYSITRYRIKLRAFLVSSLPSEAQWIKFSQLKTLPMPAPHRKLADQLLKKRSFEKSQ